MTFMRLSINNLTLAEPVSGKFSELFKSDNKYKKDRTLHQRHFNSWRRNGLSVLPSYNTSFIYNIEDNDKLYHIN